MITGDKLETLERWLFSNTEPPYEDSYEQLAALYLDNLRELNRVEYESNWEVADLACNPSEIQEVVEARSGRH